MIVYREQQRSARPDELLRRLRRRVEALPRRTDHDAIVSVLVDVGALDAGVEDALGWIARHADRARPPIVLILGSLYLAGEVLRKNGQPPA